MTDGPVKFSTSRGSRFLRLGSLSGKVGASYLGHSITSRFRDAESAARSLIRTNARNALRMASTFGELKGAVMKVGQMMSLHEDLLPQEMRDILRGLQNQAPPAPFSQMRPILLGELGAKVEELFAEISETAYASASIGQVHWGKLRDGREVVIKIQYPGVEEMVASDLKNLRMFVSSMRQVTPIKADLDRFFIEARSRLTEELDYRLELMNMREFRELYGKDARFIVPQPIAELSTRRVLTIDYYPGITAETLCGESASQRRRDRIGTDLLDGLLAQVFEFRTLQADPNLANFAFTEDDRIILYDFGCVKRFSVLFVEGIRKLVRDAFLGRYNLLRSDLENVGYVDRGKQPLPDEAYQAYADAVLTNWRKPEPFDFGASHLLRRVMKLHERYWQKAFDYDAPADAVFMHRAFAGMYGNLRKLKARVPMYELLKKHLQL